MPVVIVETPIKAALERCFDLARDIDVHCATTARTKERAVAGVTSGLIGMGQSVTFEAVHFGVRQRLSSAITEFQRPHRFVDEMTQGAFASLKHTHEFSAQDEGTLMRDILEWQAPLGILGVVADRLFLEKYLRAFLIRRGLELKKWAESQ